MSVPPRLSSSLVSRAESYSFFFGLIGFVATVCYLRNHPTLSLWNSFFALTATVLPMVLIYLFGLKVWKNASTGLSFDLPNSWNWDRVFTKYLGLVTTLALVVFAYWIFPTYRSEFFLPFHQLAIFLPWVLLFAIPYILWIDRYMSEPHDGYWHLGCLMLGRLRRIDFSILRIHFFSWVIKAFFFPLMFVYFSNNLKDLVFWEMKFGSFLDLYKWIWHLTLTLDVLFASIGYLFTLRLFDSHIRSTEPTLMGWLAALICYEPFWGLLGTMYLSYTTDFVWYYWLKEQGPLQIVWGTTILLLTSVYTWATLSFGFRFSNLTNRGIVTHGPYRFFKHPAYLCKNLSWWLIEIPFVASVHWSDSLRHCVLLILLNLIYVLRARTEERHLLQDPHYVTYSRYIDEHGIFSRFRKMFRNVR